MNPSLFDRQRGHLFLWAPILLAIGIGGYFALRFEPAMLHYAWAAGLLCSCVIAAWAAPQGLRPLLLAGAMIISGALLAGGRAHLVAEPVLTFRYYGPIEGRVVKVDRSVSDKVRLTLGDVWLSRMSPDRRPAFVRISLHGDYDFEPRPGLRVMTTGHLSPPQGPVEPAGFDFRRNAWFQGLGAVGYTRVPTVLSGPEDRSGLALARLRDRISDGVTGAMPGKAGAFAAAVTTGDRSAMDKQVLEDLRASNLAHLLAISGLHMGLLTGFIFAAVRVGFALVPWVALRWPTKKLAALVSLAAGAFYFALSGGNVATERAFIMVAVMFVAILMDRRAITLRAVAIAALVVLCLRPETLMQPGFQMSFAATTALVAVFGSLRGWDGQVLPKWTRPVVGLVLSSAVAGLATAPVAAAHFNRLADYGLLANVLSVPLMGLVVMPGAVLAALLWPTGLSWIGLAVMKPGIDWILGVASWVAGLDGSVTSVVAPSGAVLPILALGALWLILWQGPARWAGVAPIAASFVLWSMVERPAVLIADSGRLMGQMTPQGRALSKAKGDGFVAQSWLENDGDPGAQHEAFARAGLGADLAGGGDVAVARLAQGDVVLLRGRDVEERLTRACAAQSGAIYVVAKKIEPAAAGCEVYDALRFRKTGAIAVTDSAAGLTVVTVRDVSGTRLWSPE